MFCFVLFCFPEQGNVGEGRKVRSKYLDHVHIFGTGTIEKSGHTRFRSGLNELDVFLFFLVQLDDKFNKLKISTL